VPPVVHTVFVQGKRVLNRGNVLKQIWLNNGKVEDSLKKTFLIDESDSAKLAKFSEILRQLCVSKPNNKWELKVTGKRYEEFETYVKNLIEDEKKELPNPPKNEPPNGVQRKKFRGKARSPDPDPAPPSLSTSLPDPFAAQEALLAKLNELIPPAYRVTVAEVKDRRRELRHDYEGSTLRPTVMYFDGVPMVETDPAWLGNDDYCSNDVLEVNVNSPIMHVQYDVNESVYFYNEEGGVVHWCNEKEKWIEVESVEDVKKSRRKHVLTLASPDDYSVKVSATPTHPHTHPHPHTHTPTHPHTHTPTHPHTHTPTHPHTHTPTHPHTCANKGRPHTPTRKRHTHTHLWPCANKGRPHTQAPHTHTPLAQDLGSGANKGVTLSQRATNTQIWGCETGSKRTAQTTGGLKTTVSKRPAQNDGLKTTGSKRRAQTTRLQ